VNHPASLKTSDQPSFSSANFSPFISAETVWESDISPVSSLNLKPNSRGGISKKLKSSPYKNLLRQLRKWKSNRPLNPKPVSLRRMLFLVLQKDGRRGFAGIQLRLTFHQIRTMTLLFFLRRFDGKRRGTRRWLCVLYWSFLWRPQWRRLDMMCEMFQMGAHTLCWYGGRFCLWDFSGINAVLFLVCILCICNSINSVTILCAFCVNCSPPQIRNTCGLT
jgi:hypothetical protein